MTDLEGVSGGNSLEALRAITARLGDDPIEALRALSARSSSGKWWEGEDQDDDGERYLDSSTPNGLIYAEGCMHEDGSFHKEEDAVAQFFQGGFDAAFVVACVNFVRQHVLADSANPSDKPYAGWLLG